MFRLEKNPKFTGHELQPLQGIEPGRQIWPYSRLHPPLICSDMSLRPFLSVTSAGSHLTRHKGSKAWNPPARSLCSQQREARTFTGRAVTPSPCPPIPTGHVPQDRGGYHWGCWSLHWPEAPSSGRAPGSAASIVIGGGDEDGDAVKQGLYDSQT